MGAWAPRTALGPIQPSAALSFLPSGPLLAQKSGERRVIWQKRVSNAGLARWRERGTTAAFALLLAPKPHFPLRHPLEEHQQAVQYVLPTSW
jgi:hypothetical protein